MPIDTHARRRASRSPASAAPGKPAGDAQAAPPQDPARPQGRDGEPVDDAALARGIARRDAAALEKLYDRYSGLVYAVCLRVLDNQSDAQDAVIDTFWEVWDKPDRYDAGRGSMRSYLLIVARCRAIDRRRSGRHHPTVSLREDGFEENGSSSHFGAAEPGPAESALLVEQRHRVRAALRHLSEPQRQAIELSFFDGLSHRQIAEKLGQPLGTIKARIRQGLIHLRDFLRTADGR